MRWAIGRAKLRLFHQPHLPRGIKTLEGSRRRRQPSIVWRIHRINNARAGRAFAIPRFVDLDVALGVWENLSPGEAMRCCTRGRSFGGCGA